MPFYKGQIFTEEHRKRLSDAQMGRIPWNKGLKKDDPRVKSYCPKKTGSYFSCDNCQKNHYRPKYKQLVKYKFCSTDCFKNWKKSRTKEELYSFGIGYWKGKRFTEEHIQKLSGKNGNNWQGGVTPENERQRKTRDYALWRTSVFMRDNYTCQNCNQQGGKLHADHIKPFALFPELRLAIDNGRTLCEECHKNTSTYGGRILNYGS